MSYTVTRTVARPRLGLDIDGVLYDWQGAYRFLANHYLGANLPPVEEFWFETGADKHYLTPEQREWLWTEGVRRGLFRYGHVLKGCVEALRVLADMADLVIVTHRPTAYHLEVPEWARRIGVEDTLDWLAYLRLPLAEVHILPKSQPKSSVPCHVYLDDGPHVIEDLLEHTDAKVLLWDQPWNRNFNPVPGFEGHDFDPGRRGHCAVCGVSLPSHSDAQDERRRASESRADRFSRVSSWDEAIGHVKDRSTAAPGRREDGPYGGIGMRDERA